MRTFGPLLGLLLLTACGDPPENPPPPTDQDTDTPKDSDTPQDTDTPEETDAPTETDVEEGDLEGLRFVLESAQGFTPVPDVPVVLQFEVDTFSLDAGCNNIGGSYAVTDGALVTTDVFSTLIACNSEISAQETFMVGVVTSSPAATWSEERLVLTTDDATLVFAIEELPPGQDLLGPTWSVDTLLSGQTASTMTLTVPPTMHFDANGTITVFTACNTGTANYTATATDLTFTTFSYTEAGCADAAEANIEMLMINLFSAGTRSYEVAGQRLTVLDGDVGVSAVQN